MTEAALRICTLAPTSDFLRELAQLVLKGFPRQDHGSVQPPDLHTWTILVPTRRAARALQRILFEESGRQALLLPRIRPIGDLDEDLILEPASAGDLPPGLSPTGRLFVLIGLITEWAEANAHLPLAADLRRSSGQAQALAISLAKLLDQVEEEGLALEALVALYDIELAVHRVAVLGLIDLLRTRLPTVLARHGVMDARARRNHLIRLEAQRIAAAPDHGPIIAAGSTGTIAATRELLKAIAQHRNGAVILPGLDLAMDEEDWLAVNPQHPQHALKRLLNSLGATRADVMPLDSIGTPRSWLASETMRASETTERWQVTLRNTSAIMQQARQGLHLISARDRPTEARNIALVLRHTLETPGRTAALITPDRDLARRVKIELRRWQVEIDDTAGEPLVRFGAASLLYLLITVVMERFSVASLVSLFGHELCQLDLPRAQFQQVARNLEIGVFRNQSFGAGLGGLQLGLQRAMAVRKAGHRLAQQAAKLTDTDWQDMTLLVEKLTVVLAPIEKANDLPFGAHLQVLLGAMDVLAPDLDWAAPANAQLEGILTALTDDGNYFPVGPFAKAAEAIIHVLSAELFRSSTDSNARLSIMGLLEARLMRPDVAILGGLNEGHWPAQPDAGPWLNRPMRDGLGVQQPEREIGQTAHDFVQAFGNPEVYLSWSQRIDNEPAIASRWILRLRTIMQAGGIADDEQIDGSWSAMAGLIDRPTTTAPHGKPRPSPPQTMRPRHFSVTEINKLMRDPYAIYARRVLKLEPLPPLGMEPDAALRGQLFHAAIGDWNEALRRGNAEDLEDLLIAMGRRAFAPFRADPEIAHFWWPRFLRMAKWLAANEPLMRQGVAASFAEVKGLLKFMVLGQSHTLSARADRLDVFDNGTARVLDYKSGTVPTDPQIKTGLEPQLSLEAAMLAAGAFEGIAPLSTSELVYVQIGGGYPPGEISRPGSDGRTLFEPMDIAVKHLAKLQELLAAYMAPEAVYIPRHAIEREDDATDYDHLSRYREWMLAGSA